MWKTFGRAAKELFFPKRCFFCQKYGASLCSDCRELMDVSPVHRYDCSKKYLDDIYSACVYENKFAQKLIHGLKYKPFAKELAIPAAEIIAGHFSLCGKNTNGCILTAVPLFKKNLRRRGFNQAQEIAKNMAKIWQIPMVDNCLIKIRETENQAKLTQSQRMGNLRGAFAVADKNIFRQKNIFLIDDVVTTGATMEECAKVLRRSGAAEVIGICFARTEK